MAAEQKYYGQRLIKQLPGFVAQKVVHRRIYPGDFPLGRNNKQRIVQRNVLLALRELFGTLTYEHVKTVILWQAYQRLFPAQGQRLMGMYLDFWDFPVVMGDEIMVKGEVENVRREETKVVMTVRVWAANQHRGTIFQGRYVQEQDAVQTGQQERRPEELHSGFALWGVIAALAAALLAVVHFDNGNPIAMAITRLAQLNLRDREGVKRAFTFEELADRSVLRRADEINGETGAVDEPNVCSVSDLVDLAPALVYLHLEAHDVLVESLGSR